jgi:hypothetical protein
MLKGVRDLVQPRKEPLRARDLEQQEGERHLEKDAGHDGPNAQSHPSF